MKRCLACHQSKPDSEFPSGGALTCNFCTPTSDRLTTSVLRDPHMLGKHGKNPSMVDIANATGNPGRGYAKPSMRDFAVASNTMGRKQSTFDLGIQPGDQDALMRDASGGLKQPTSIYDGIRTQRATAKDDSVKRLLLNTSRKLDAAVAAGYSPEYHPSLDELFTDQARLRKGTFRNARGMSIVDDKYVFRMLLRKAQCSRSMMPPSDDGEAYSHWRLPPIWIVRGNSRSRRSR